MSDREESEQQGGSLSEEIAFEREEFVKIILASERRAAEKLGTCERLEKWEKTECFAAARQEWIGAWKVFARNNRFDSLFAWEDQTLEQIKDFALTMLRRSKDPKVALQNQTAVIYAATREGDVSFFNAIHSALKSRGRRVEADFERSFLGWNILLYWFAGLLWLMNDSAARAALCSYTRRRDITQEAYEKSRRRLGLNGHPDRVKRSPVVLYEPAEKIYKVRSWTN